MTTRRRAIIGLLVMGAFGCLIGWNARGTWGRWHNEAIFDQCTGFGIIPEAGGASIVVEGERVVQFASVADLAEACAEALKHHP